jgi:hypothetical protein
MLLIGDLNAAGRTQLLFNPFVRDCQAILEGNRGFPPKHLTQPRIVAITPADTLWLREVVTLFELLAGNFGDDVHQPINRDQPIGAEIEGVAMVGIETPLT